MLCNYRMSGYGYEYQEGSRPDSSAIHLASSSHIWSLLAGKKHTLTQSKVGQLLQEDISGHYFTQLISKVDQKLNQVKLESNIAPNHLSHLYEGISGHYLPQFI